mgnify:FL=1
MSLIKDKTINVKIDRKILFNGLQMAEVMKAGGSLYEDHPVFILLKNIHDNLPFKKESKNG